MPEGLVVVRWDNRIGTVLEAKFPKELKISPDLPMRIYGVHVLGEERGAGFITMKVRELGIASYFSGTNLNHFVALLLNEDERGEDYEEGLTEAAARIFAAIAGKKYKGLLKDLYARVARAPMMTEEQKLALVFSNDARFKILTYLVENGSSTKSELESLLREELRMKAIDINPIIAPLIKLGLVTTEWVEGLPSECVFLNPDVQTSYLNKVTAYFKEYEHSDGDVSVISNILVEPDTYDAITILRTGPSTRKEIQEKTKLSDGDVAKLIEKLEHTEFLVRLQDKKDNEHIFLRSDPRIVTFFPEHCIVTEIKRYNERLVPPRQAIHHLAILREHFPTE
jgi:DNA-binding MarR family transcriptional regulator